MRASSESCSCGRVFEFTPGPQGLVSMQEPRDAGWGVYPNEDLRVDGDDFLVCPDCLAKRTR